MAASAASLCAVFASSSVLAEGGYFGIGSTYTRMEDAGTTLIGTVFDDHDAGVKIFAGYQFNPNVAFEVGYTDFGKFSASGAVSVPPFGTVDGDRWEATGVSVSALLGGPISPRFSIFARAGLIGWNVDDTFVLNGSPVSASASGTSLDVGVGAQYRFGRLITGRLEWEQIPKVGDTDTTGRSDLAVVSANLLFRF
ncbi:MAG: outer membrane beta-barrel protein [Sulfurifustis sp.]